MKHQQNKTILNAADKFAQPNEPSSPQSSTLQHSSKKASGKSPSIKSTQEFVAKPDLAQLTGLFAEALNDENLEVSKVRPFFWSLVEVYLDRFEKYPFDVSKALFSHLELNEYPETMVEQLVKQLELEFEKTHGRPLRKSTQLLSRNDALTDEIKELRDSLKYAGLVAETEE